ncbi:MULTISPECIES: hypothetical protein [Acinetobacter]|uniref:hypothetical protein n=1 Tax=Acinetobacter TaxID=469 RepID=UPI0015D41F9B|nr:MULTISPECIES: hypothetical protein [Acinetobacter]MCL6237202.1 hypothetical protein [Acinetobacter amyesii]
MNFSRFSFINPNDIDLFGTLNRNRALTNDEVAYLFAKRGIIYGKNTSRELLAKEFSSFFHSSYDYHLIEASLATENKRSAAVSGLVIDNLDSLNNRQILGKLDALETKITQDIEKQEEIDIDKVIYKRNGTKSRQITVNYSVYDFTKNAFNRRERKEASIYIKPVDGSNSLYVEFPNTKELGQLVESQVIDAISDSFSKPSKTKIELLGITDNILRKQFFDTLIRDISEFDYDTVLDIYVTKESSSTDDPPSIVTSVASIRKASFSGHGLMDVPELDTLLAKGFHIYRVIWQSRSVENDEDIFVFEAKFLQPDECTGFSYYLKGRKTNNDKIEQCSLTETMKMNREIYFAAIRSLNKITSTEV